jgi:hypothetical protein
VVIPSSKTVAPTGTISFQNSSGQIAGTVAYTTVTDQNGYLDLQGILTINATFSDNFVAAYSGDANYPAANSYTGPIAVTGNDFTLSFPQPSVTISRGSYAQLNMFIGMQNSTSPVLFTATPCSGMPKETTCGANSTSVSYTSMNLLSLSATAPHSALRQSALQKPPNWWIAPAVTLCCGIMLFGTVAPRRRRWATLVVLQLIMLLTMLPSCGGGGSGGGGGGGGGPTDPGTPAGSYPITVTATSGSGSAAITHSSTFTLIVK